MTAAGALPLVGHRHLDAPVAWRDGRPVTAGRFIAEAEQLAARLPAGRAVLNLCEDRYRFAVAFAAALIAGKTSLHPPNRSAGALAQVARAYPGCTAVAEAHADGLEVPTLLYPDDLAGGPAARVPMIAVDQIAAVAFTSGSTGTPVASVKRWGGLHAVGAAECVALELPEGFSLLATVPPQHMYGFETSVLVPLVGGGAMHPARPLFPADVRAALESLPAPRVLVTTPIHIRACIEAGVALPPISVVVSAAAPLAPELAEAAERRFDTRVMEIYGFTEAGAVASRCTTVTRVWRALPGVRLLRTADGYAFEGGPVPGRVLASDVLVPAGESTFTLEGRSADMINIAGKRASLADLNHKLAAIPGVEDGVFHVPAGGAGEVTRLMAFVVAPSLAEADLLESLRQLVDPAFLPRPLVKVSALPRTATGKLTLDALRALEAEVRSRRGAVQHGV